MSDRGSFLRIWRVLFPLFLISLGVHGLVGCVETGTDRFYLPHDHEVDKTIGKAPDTPIQIGSATRATVHEYLGEPLEARQDGRVEIYPIKEGAKWVCSITWVQPPSTEQLRL